MVKDEKKNFVPHKGNKVNQKLKNPKFVDEFNEWRSHCQSVSGADLKVKNIPNLYAFLKKHFTNVRQNSRNAQFIGEGANELLTIIERGVDDDLFTIEFAKIVEQLATVLDEYKDTGNDAGGKGIAADPAFILFTEKVTGRAGQKLRDKVVQGHYRTKTYVGEGGDAVPDEWLAGQNPPHQALYSETATAFAQPRGLYHIMKDASKGMGKNAENFSDMEVEVGTIPEGFEASDFEEISSIERYFDKVVRNRAFWKGGRLILSKLRKDFQNQTFIMSNKDQSTVRELANLGKVGEKDAIAGKVESVKLTATALPLITLVDRALKRKNTNKAPDDYRAWQSERKTGFDYRKTAREAFGDKAGKNPNKKVISKMWQQYLWR